MSASEAAGRDPGISGLLASARAAWTEGRRTDAVGLWKRAIATAPGIVAPYLNLARASLDLGTHDTWIVAAATAMSGDDPLVARNLAVLARQRGLDRVAWRHMRQAAVLAPHQAATMKLLAKLSAAGDTGHDPLRWSMRAAIAEPADAAAWTAALTALAGAGRTDDAIRCAAAMPIAPANCPDDLLQLARQWSGKAKRYQQACACAAELARRHPLSSVHRREHALALQRSGDTRGAIREARRAVLLAPGGFDDVSRLAVELARGSSQPQAVTWFRRSLCIAPRRRLQVVENLGAALVQSRSHAEAGQVLREAMIDRPDRVPPYSNMGTLGFQELDLACAERFWRRAVMAGPTQPDTWYNLATLQRHQGRTSEARRSVERALGLRDKPMYRYLQAMLELGDGDPVEGVKRYEVRWQVPGFSAPRSMGDAPSLPLPVWRGEPIRDRALALWGEQGVGDEIWFAGYVPWAVARAGRVVLEVAESLQALMQRSFPEVDVRSRDAGGTEEAMLAADLQLPLGSLMPLLNAGERPVPVGYLRADPARVAEMRARYLGSRGGARRLIGISWRSMKVFKGRRLLGTERFDAFKRGRSFEAPLDQWGALFRIEDAAFVSLQYGDVADDVRLARDRFGIELVADPAVNAYDDLDGLAAQVAAVDHVVTVANSTVTLAHALGRPVDVLAMAVQDDWRYRRWASRTRWLPTARCTWQRDPRDWAAPIAEVARLLRGSPGEANNCDCHLNC